MFLWRRSNLKFSAIRYEIAAVTLFPRLCPFFGCNDTCSFIATQVIIHVLYAAFLLIQIQQQNLLLNQHPL